MDPTQQITLDDFELAFHEMRVRKCLQLIETETNISSVDEFIDELAAHGRALEALGSNLIKVY